MGKRNLASGLSVMILVIAVLHVTSCRAPNSPLIPDRGTESQYLRIGAADGSPVPDRGTISISDALVDSGDPYLLSLENVSNRDMDIGSGISLEGTHAVCFAFALDDSSILAPGRSVRLSIRCLGSLPGDSADLSCQLRIHERAGGMPDLLLYLEASRTTLGHVSTLAGPVTSEEITVDGIGRAATFDSLGGIATDGANLYVTEKYNHTIRKINIASRAVTTIAGGYQMRGSEDGIGTEARFYHPTNVACDGANLYIADSGKYTIRKMNLSTMVITTLTGEADISGIRGMCLIDGYLYIASNNMIRRVDCDTGTVTTIAGSSASDTVNGIGTAARFENIQSLSSVGTTLYASQYNNLLRAIDLSTMEVTTVAGSEGQSGSDDGVGPAARFSVCSAMSGYGGALYISDSNRIRRFDPVTARVTTVIESQSMAGLIDGSLAFASHSYSNGMCLAGESFYLASQDCVRLLDLAGDSLTTIAGNPFYSCYDDIGQNARFSYPYGVAYHSGSIYIGEYATHAIRRVDAVTGAVELFAGMPGGGGNVDGVGDQARFRSPVGLAIGEETLYVSDIASHTIRSVDLETREVRTIAGLDGAAGSDDGIGSAARFDMPFALAYGDGVLYVADTENRTIRAIDLGTTAVSTIAGTAGVSGSDDGVGPSASFYYLAGLTYADGALYATDGNRIRKIDIATRAVSSYYPNSDYNFLQNYGLFHRNGFLYIAEYSKNMDWKSSRIHVLDMATGVTSILSGYPGTTGMVDGPLGAGRFGCPIGITGDAVNLYVADYGNCNIRKIGR